ncbi:UbiA family prenyltransferase [Lacisediminihabitans changchengi]|uniref:UbiA family prenyltransferase n=1 Tax=Lacisediminihabitans changchengi TaxID=2787634 RepID=A0A934SJQ1_9MICO|nr:UbiA family prenyltransferase [Lacisediminihabitans changchengi]MBK4346556.1 UbiA family prenyltransferase [Lacisediminihabitans changchengi]
MASRLRALALSTHPGPGLAVTVVAVLLGIGLHLAPWRIVLLGLAVLANQVSVGLSNDWLDAERDRAVGRTDKPVALGLVSVRLVRASAIAAAALGVLLTVPLGLWATITHAVFIGAAWAYNAGLKNTPISVLPYIVGFGLLPSVATLSRPDPVFAAPWAFGLGAMLGVAAHFANVLPDLEDDARTGIAGLPHRIGRRASGVVIWVALGLGAVFAFVGPSGAKIPVQWVGLAITLLLAAAIAVVLRRPPTRLLFQLIIAAALVNVVLLVFSGDRLLG